MSGTRLQWSFDDAPLRERLLALGHASLEPAKREIGAYMVQQVQERFAEQRLWDGSAMPQSEAAKTGVGRKGGQPGQTLIDQGHLRDSYTYNTTPEGVDVGSNMIYAAIHHFGGETGRGHATHIIPRPVLGVNEQDEQEIGDILLRSLGAPL